MYSMGYYLAYLVNKAAIPPKNSMNTANQAYQYTNMGNIQISNPMMMARAIIAPPLACFVSTINITSSIVTMFFLLFEF